MTLANATQGPVGTVLFETLEMCLSMSPLPLCTERCISPQNMRSSVPLRLLSVLNHAQHRLGRLPLYLPVQRNFLFRVITPLGLMPSNVIPTATSQEPESHLLDVSVKVHSHGGGIGRLRISENCSI